MSATRSLPCNRCGSPTVEISMLEADARLTMRSCSRCDHRTWLRGDVTAPLDAVLAAVASTGRRRSA